MVTRMGQLQLMTAERPARLAPEGQTPKANPFIHALLRWYRRTKRQVARLPVAGPVVGGALGGSGDGLLGDLLAGAGGLLGGSFV